VSDDVHSYWVFEKTDTDSTYYIRSASSALYLGDEDREKAMPSGEWVYAKMVQSKFRLPFRISFHAKACRHIAVKLSPQLHHPSGQWHALGSGTGFGDYVHEFTTGLVVEKGQASTYSNTIELSAGFETEVSFTVPIVGAGVKGTVSLGASYAHTWEHEYSKSTSGITEEKCIAACQQIHLPKGARSVILYQWSQTAKISSQDSETKAVVETCHFLCVPQMAQEVNLEPQCPYGCCDQDRNSTHPCSVCSKKQECEELWKYTKNPLTVVGTRQESAGSGRYFYVDALTWVLFVEEQYHKNHRYRLLNVKQCRGGAEIWTGKIRFWNFKDKKGQAVGDSCGRREPHKTMGVWSVGDQIVPSEEACPA